MRTFGIEEEFVLLDQETGMPAAPAGSGMRALRAAATQGDIQDEWLACQIEFATDVCEHRSQALDQIHGFRSKLSHAAATESLLAVSMGALPVIPAESAQITQSARYQQIARYMPAIAAEHYLCGLHIHVGIESRDEGVLVMNALRPWLPVLAGFAANSPFWRASETGFASWRTIQYRRWSVQGIPPVFRDGADYDQRLASILDSDAVLDPGHVSWGVRLSKNQPTIEVRMADAQLRAGDSVLLALLVRALVDTTVRQPSRRQRFAPEYLDLAFWQGAKEGLDGPWLNPWTQRSTSARSLLIVLMDHLEPALRRNGDLEPVRQRMHEILTHGNGATRQRAAFADGALSGLIRLAGRELVI